MGPTTEGPAIATGLATTPVAPRNRLSAAAAATARGSRSSSSEKQGPRVASSKSGAAPLTRTAHLSTDLFSPS
eukprot:2575956-Alexandrium_andersonii.AAC.1